MTLPQPGPLPPGRGTGGVFVLVRVLVLVEVLVLVLVTHFPRGFNGSPLLEQNEHEFPQSSQNPQLLPLQQVDLQPPLTGGNGVLVALSRQVSPTGRQPSGEMGFFEAIHRLHLAVVAGPHLSQGAHLPFRQHEEKQPPQG